MGPNSASMGSWPTATHRAQTGPQGVSDVGADRTTRGCGTDVHEVAHRFPAVLCSPPQLLYFCKCTVERFCREGSEMPTHTQRLTPSLATADSRGLLHQWGRAMSHKSFAGKKNMECSELTEGVGSPLLGCFRMKACSAFPFPGIWRE